MESGDSHWERDAVACRLPSGAQSARRKQFACESAVRRSGRSPPAGAPSASGANEFNSPLRLLRLRKVGLRAACADSAPPRHAASDTPACPQPDDTDRILHQARTPAQCAAGGGVLVRWRKFLVFGGMTHHLWPATHTPRVTGRHPVSTPPHLQQNQCGRSSRRARWRSFFPRPRLRRKRIPRRGLRSARSSTRTTRTTSDGLSRTTARSPRRRRGTTSSTSTWRTSRCSTRRPPRGRGWRCRPAPACR